MSQVLVIAALAALYILSIRWGRTRADVLLSRWWRNHRVRTAADWPATQGYVAQIEESRNRNGLLTVILAYTYKVNDERYVARESFRFIRDEDAAQFETACKQRSVLVHYRPDKPNISVLAPESIP